MSRLIVIFNQEDTPLGPALKIGGIVNRELAHQKGIPHGAVQLGVIIQKMRDGKPVSHILLHCAASMVRC